MPCLYESSTFGTRVDVAGGRIAKNADRGCGADARRERSSSGFWGRCTSAGCRAPRGARRSRLRTRCRCRTAPSWGSGAAGEDLVAPRLAQCVCLQGGVLFRRRYQCIADQRHGGLFCPLFRPPILMSENPLNKRLSDKCPAWPTKDRLADGWEAFISSFPSIPTNACQRRAVS
jgi:hypothetical protein